jgi:hypothetical protein
MKPRHVFFFIVGLLTIFACQQNKTADVGLESVSIERLDKQLMSFSSKTKLQEFLINNPWYTRDLYRAFPDDTAFVSHLYYIISHPGTKDFYNQIDSTFGDLANLQSGLEKAFANIKSHYPLFNAPKVYTTFTGLENDLFVSDSTIIIALEAFIGPNAMYRPDQPNYILSRYQEAYLVPAIVRLLSHSYIKSSGEGSMLNDMVYFGKSYEFTKVMLPETADSLIMSLPDSSLVSNWYAQDLIWAHFIDKKLLYEQNHKIKEKYLGERPKTPEIGSKCPGRIGQWLGWRIIAKFRTENPDATFEELMNMTDAQEILRKSKYRGQVEEE